MLALQLAGALSRGHPASRLKTAWPWELTYLSLHASFRPSPAGIVIQITEPWTPELVVRMLPAGFDFRFLGSFLQVHTRPTTVKLNSVFPCRKFCGWETNKKTWWRKIKSLPGSMSWERCLLDVLVPLHLLQHLLVSDLLLSYFYNYSLDTRLTYVWPTCTFFHHDNLIIFPLPHYFSSLRSSIASLQSPLISAAKEKPRYDDRMEAICFYNNSTLL